jgi:hypothetical protein
VGGLKTSIYPEKSTTVTGPIFMKTTPARQCFVKTSCTKFRENPTSDLVADSWSHASDLVADSWSHAVRRGCDAVRRSVCS